MVVQKNPSAEDLFELYWGQERMSRRVEAHLGLTHPNRAVRGSERVYLCLGDLGEYRAAKRMTASYCRPEVGKMEDRRDWYLMMGLSSFREVLLLVD